MRKYLYSSFLGYPEEDCRHWVEDCRYNRLGWVGQTVYTLVDAMQLELLRSHSLRCFPSGSDTATVTVMAHPDGCRLRRNVEGLSSDLFLCRFALENAFYVRLFERAQPDGTGLVSTQLGVPPEELNASLVSSIERWANGTWAQH